MCGINGFNWKDPDRVAVMNSAIAHRGPDASGVAAFDRLSLGSVRLAIFDLSDAGNQPMYSADQNLCIVFNGEIYNFSELRKAHCPDYKFHSGADTEIILALYQKYGTACVDYLNGMWAFALYDKQKQLLFCSRDRLGIKPFYYHVDGEKFVFSSEIKALLTHELSLDVNPNAVTSYLRYRYVLQDETFFAGVKKLQPGHSLVYDLQRHQFSIRKFWDLDQCESDLSCEEALSTVANELQRSIDYRMLADVEVGSILSGGLDSSVLTALAAQSCSQPLRSYTVQFAEQGFDESSFAELAARRVGTNHEVLKISREEYLAAMDRYLQYQDEPVGVPNEVALFLLFGQIRKSVKVVLSGEGADEIFAGYGRIFRLPFVFEQRLLNDPTLRFSDQFSDLYGYFNDADINALQPGEQGACFREVFAESFEHCPRDYGDKISYVFLKHHLPGLLQRTDTSSMANSVEARVPFLDHNLVQAVYQLPFSYKNRFRSVADMRAALDKEVGEISEVHDIPKYLLKQIAEPLLPPEIVNRKKQGFPLPLNAWFGDTFVDDGIADLLAKDSPIAKFIDRPGLKSWSEQNQRDPLFGQKLWMLYSLNLWLKSTKEQYGIS